MIWLALAFALFVILCQWVGTRDFARVIQIQDAIIRKQDELITKLESLP